MTPAPIRQEKYSDSNPVVSFLIRRFFERVRGAVAGLAARTVLDAGCGEGEIHRRRVFDPGVAVFSVDLAPSLPEGIAGRAVRGSVLALPFSDQSFDAALCLEVLEHLADPAAAVRELGRVTRGALVLSVPYEPYFRAGNFLRGKYWRGLGNYPEHVQHWNLRTFRSFLAPLVGGAEVEEAFPWIIARCRPL